MTLAIAHRGDPVNHVENTLEGFLSAQALGADMVELDCRLTRDGRPIVLHDPTLRRIWGVPRPAAELTWEQVREIRAGGYRVPQLAEVAAEIALPLMVDLPGPAVAHACLDILERAGATGRCIFAGHTGALLAVRRRLAGARVALSWDRRRLPPHELMCELKPHWFNPSARVISAGAVREMHERGVGVSVWTVDSRWGTRRALRAGVDAVITNRVGRLVAALGTGAPAITV